MTRSRGYTLLALSLCVLTAGCSHFREDRAIAAFTDALVAGDIAELRAVTSSDFEQKALRRSEALDDLQVLNLPEEPPAIVEVKEISDTEKQVTVTEPDGSSNLLYKLVLDDTTGRWVVDDIFTRQQRAGVTVSKPISEQMDLLLTIREFLDRWEEDDREAVLAITTPEFRGVLSELPAPWLARITRQVVGSSQSDKSRRRHKPQVAIDGTEAVVRLPRTDGTLQLSLEMDQMGWKVADAAIKTSREETGIGSVRNHARVLAAGTNFVEAFRQSDKATLKKLSTEKFYDRVLVDADLKSASLPDILLAPKDYELKATVDHATMLVPVTGSILQLDLDRVDADVADSSNAHYLVKEVSLFKGDSKDQIRLSAFFTASKQVRAFHDALAGGNLKVLKRVCSRRLNSSVWSQVSGLPVQLLPMGPVADSLQELKSPKFSGSTTQVSAQHSSGTAIYVLRDSEGRLVIDDVLIGTAEKNRSLRKSLELAIPVLSFASGIETGQLKDLQRVSSDDFNRRVWDRTDDVPSLSAPIASNLTKPIRSMRTQPGRAMIELGTPQSGAVVSLVSEREHWVIDDIEIVTGLEPSKHVQLKQAMRDVVLANREGARLQQRTARAEPAPDARKRFDLRRRDGVEPSPKNRKLAMVPAPAESVTPPTPLIAEPDAFEAEPVPTIVQASREINGPDDPGVTHAMMFESIDKPVSNEPGIISPATDAAPIEVSKAGSQSSSDGVDLDALFSDIEAAPTEAPSSVPGRIEVSPTAEPIARAVSSPAVREVVSNEIPTNDPGRVTDPALQPIRIPQ